MAKHTKKPVTIDAVQVTAADFNGSTFDGSPFSESPEWLIAALEAHTLVPVGQDTDYAVWDVRTTEGVMRAVPGDWIIQGVEGEIYPCRDSVFQATYVAGDAGEQKHQGLPVPGYRPQSEANILISKVNKELEERCIRQAEGIRDMPGMDARMAALAITQIQQGFMWLNRAVFQPGRVALPEDGQTRAA